LRRAIEHAKATRIRLAKLEAAVVKAEEHEESAGTKLQAVVAETVVAKERHATLMAQAIAEGTTPPPASAITNARAAEAEAGDSLKAAHAAHAQLEQQYADLKTECEMADNRVATASNAVLAEPMSELFERAKRAQAELLACRSALAALYTDVGIRFTDEIKAFHFHEQQRNSAYGKLKAEMRDFIHVNFIRDPAAESKAVEVGQIWTRARAALLNDADAEFPAVE
jgi:hypothetical protein